MIYLVGLEAAALMLELRECIDCAGHMRLYVIAFQFYRKLKELSKRTTFIRVTQQINEVFGPAPHATHESQSVGSKRSRDDAPDI